MLGRGRLFCRGCTSNDLFSVIDLGELPLANELWHTQNESIEVFPLHLMICSQCGLGQVEDVVQPSRLFRDYRYLSSVSSSFLDHAKNYVQTVYTELDFQPSDWVLEIASNDGYLLKNFVELGVSVLGLEPAVNVAKLAIAAGVPTQSDFFGLATATRILSERGYPRLIVANNVMAHVPDIQDFISGLAILAGPETRISVENPSLMNLVKSDQFDTIYHEHFSYLTAFSVKNLTRPFGLNLFHVEEISTHGGSNRYWLDKSSVLTAEDSTVAHKIGQELEDGLLNQAEWSKFESRVRKILSNFANWLEESYVQKKKVCGYGAAAKASTLLNAAHIKKEWMLAIADGSHEKQGWYMPTTGIPILSPIEVSGLNPSEILIFPWNISTELIGQIQKDISSSVGIWQAVPELKQILKP